jgi:hypothetical protein
MRSWMLAVSALALAGCRGPLVVGRALLALAGAPAWVSDPDLVTRTWTAAETMARVWGGDPRELDGWTIKYTDRYVGRRGTGRVVGKATRTPLLGGGTIEVWTGTSDVCLEATDLAHEIGHIYIHDGGHRDPRWPDRVFWGRMAEALRAIVPREDERCRERLASSIGIWH